MENKMHSELNSIMDTEKKMQQELLIVTDLHSLREKHNEHIQELLREKEMLKKKSEPTKNAVIEAQRKHDELKVCGNIKNKIILKQFNKKCHFSENSRG